MRKVTDQFLYLCFNSLEATTGGAGAFLCLLALQRKGPIPFVRRRRDLELADASGIDLIKRLEPVLLIGREAFLDHRQRAGPVAAAVAGQHVHVQLAPALESPGVRQIAAADNGIDNLRLGSYLSPR